MIAHYRPSELTFRKRNRWLLDTDQDKEGMRVIADLYGEGDANNKHARREFREIKEAVLQDVSDTELSVRAKGLTIRVCSARKGPARLSTDVPTVSLSHLHCNVCPGFCSAQWHQR